MLKKRFRLKSRPLFRKTLNPQFGTRLCSNRFFTLLGLKRTEQAFESDRQLAEQGLASYHTPRFGFVISTKVHKRANKRNKIRRRLRELVRRELLPRQLPCLNDYRTFVFIPKTAMVDARFEEIKHQFFKSFRM